jgi:hypothetical protein
MRWFAVFVALLVAPLSQAAAANFETYVQIDPSTEQNHLFVLVLLKNIDTPNDTSIAMFTLEAGKSQEQVRENVDFPDLRYRFAVEVTRAPNGTIAVIVETSVKDREQVVYQGRTIVQGYRAP